MPFQRSIIGRPFLTMSFSKGQKSLFVAFALIVGVYFLIEGLVSAKSFLAPLTMAMLLTMMFSPLANKLEKLGLNRGLSSLTSISIAALFFVGMFFLLSLQVSSIASDWPEIEEQMKPKVGNAQDWLAEKTGMSTFNETNLFDIFSDEGAGSSQKEDKKEEMLKNSSVIKSAGQALLSFFDFLSLAFLTLIYLFFLLFYRRMLKKSLLKFVAEGEQEKAQNMIEESVKLSQGYLVGKFLLILFLAILYSAGLAISGVKHAILISVIAAVLTFLPYIGNIIGFALALALAAFSGGDLGTFIGVFITFGVAQVVENYILQPYVVGDKVSLNPVAIIIVVVLGGSIWGIMGMVTFIPLFGIVKIACDHIPILKPVGFLLGNDGMKN